jgi:hypothetical protein
MRVRARNRSAAITLLLAGSAGLGARIAGELRRYQVSRVLAAFNDDLISAIKPSRSFSIRRM